MPVLLRHDYTRSDNPISAQKIRHISGGASKWWQRIRDTATGNSRKGQEDALARNSALIPPPQPVGHYIFLFLLITPLFSCSSFHDVYELRQGRQAGLQTEGSPTETQGLSLAHAGSSVHPNVRHAQYLDPIIAATWSEDGAVHDVCKALSPRFREPNAIVRLFVHPRWASLITSVVTGRVQGPHRSAHHDSQRCNRQRSRLPQLF